MSFSFFKPGAVLAAALLADTPQFGADYYVREDRGSSSLVSFLAPLINGQGVVAFYAERKSCPSGIFAGPGNAVSTLAEK